MIVQPFKIFAPLKDVLDVRMLTRQDDVVTDDEIARSLGTDALASLDQVHGNRCVILRNDSRRKEKADSLATDTSGVTLTVRFADCQNFIVFDPVHTVLCLIHAGWKGVQCEAIQHAFACLRSEWGTDPKDVLVGAGPSLCMKHAEFTDPKKEVPELAAYSEGNCIDLNRAADDQLFSLGVRRERLERMNACTLCEQETYWSYRGGEDDVTKKMKRNCLAAMLR